MLRNTQSDCTQARITACLCQFPEVTVRKADRKEAPSCRGNEVRIHRVDHWLCEGIPRDSGALEPGFAKGGKVGQRLTLWRGFVGARPGEGWQMGGVRQLTDAGNQKRETRGL